MKIQQFNHVLKVLQKPCEFWFICPQIQFFIQMFNGSIVLAVCNTFSTILFYLFPKILFFLKWVYFILFYLLVKSTGCYGC